MAERTSRTDDPLTAFGPNEWLVDEMYERYVADKSSVDQTWRDLFATYTPESQAGGNGQSNGSTNGTAAAPATKPTARAAPSA